MAKTVTVNSDSGPATPSSAAHIPALAIGPDPGLSSDVAPFIATGLINTDGGLGFLDQLSDSVILRRIREVGSLLVPVAEYSRNPEFVPTNSPSIYLLGRAVSLNPDNTVAQVSPWSILENVAGGTTTEIILDSGLDAVSADGLTKFSIPRAGAAYDPLYCNEFIAFVSTALTGAGTLTTSRLWMAII